MFPFDPFGVFDHLGVVVKGDRLPGETAKVLAVGLYLLIYLLHLGTELVDVEGIGFTDHLGNRFVG